MEHSLKTKTLPSINRAPHEVQYSVEFTKEEILEMCPKDVRNIRMLRRDDENRLMGPPKIELEFEKDTLDPHIIIGGENFQL